MKTTWRSTIPIALLLVALLLMAAVPAAQAAPEAAPAASCGYWYTVQAGQGWYSVSAATGVSVSALQAANPGKVRPPNNWLYTGEQLWIPCGAPPPPPPPPPSCGYWYTVQAGQGWYSVSAATGVSVPALQAANPGKVRPPNNWLYVGESLWIPCGAPPPPPPPPPPSGGYWYKVQPGDSWSILSARTGIPVSTLQANNPAHIHQNYWLIIGHTLWIP